MTGARAFNIGTGRGASVREMHAAFERAVGRPVPVEVHPRRPGDIAEMRARVQPVVEAWTAKDPLIGAFVAAAQKTQ